MTARTNANPGVEIKADSTGYPDELKRSYRETFFYPSQSQALQVRGLHHVAMAATQEDSH